jgi:hypothetical protein
MLYSVSNDKIEPVKFYGYQDLQGKEKNLENLLAQCMEEIFEDEQIMTIFQERQYQAEPDICGLDKDGNLIIFELKRDFVNADTTIQVMRYAQIWGQYDYNDLNENYKKWHGKKKGAIKDLMTAHKEYFELEGPLLRDRFNITQRLILVGNSTDTYLADAVKYWKTQGLDIDFIPYRFYEINNEIYFEFFSKPYDIHQNPAEKKAVMFDTCKTYIPDAIWDMFKGKKISAYGDKKHWVGVLKKSDVVFYYHKGYGVVAAGKIITSKPAYIKENDEQYHSVDFLTPTPFSEKELISISAPEIKQILGRNFFWARTAKRPYLTEEESQKLIEALNNKYQTK